MTHVLRGVGVLLLSRRMTAASSTGMALYIPSVQDGRMNEGEALDLVARGEYAEFRAQSAKEWRNSTGAPQVEGVAQVCRDGLKEGLEFARGRNVPKGAQTWCSHGAADARARRCNKDGPRHCWCLPAPPATHHQIWNRTVGQVRLALTVVVHPEPTEDSASVATTHGPILGLAVPS